VRGKEEGRPTRHPRSARARDGLRPGGGSSSDGDVDSNGVSDGDGGVEGGR
jgi:hypothetical protein